MRSTTIPVRSAAIAALAFSAIVGPATTAHAQIPIFDDFSSGNDNAWTRVDTPGLFLGVPSTYSVTNGQYRLQNPVYQAPGAFPTMSFRQDSFAGDSQISVDIADWSDASNNVICLVARFTPTSATTAQSYKLTFLPTSNAGDGISFSNLRIDRWNPNNTITFVTPFNAEVFPRVSASDAFRLVFTLSGTSLTGELFNISGPTPTLVKRITGTDSGSGSLADGLAGLSVFGNGTSGPADATFDNFRVIPAPGAAAAFVLSGALLARRRRH